MHPDPIPTDPPAWQRFLPGVPDLFCALLALPLLAQASTFTHDTWWHLTQGQHTLRTGSIPRTEAFSWTAPGEPIAGTTGWLTDLLFAWLVERGGLPLLEVLAVVLVALTFRCVYGIARALDASPVLACAGLYAFALSSHSLFILRPQLFTFLGFAGLFWIYVHLRRHPASRVVWAAPGIVLMWTNLHGGVFLGLAFLVGVAGLEWVESRWPGVAEADAAASRRRARTLAMVAGASLLTFCVHPSGPVDNLRLLLETPLGTEAALTINEWLPPPPDRVPLFEPTLILALLVLALLRQRPPLFEAAGFLAAAHLGLTVWRHMPLYGIVGLPILAAWWTRALQAQAPAHPGRASRWVVAAGTLDRLAGAGERGPGGFLALLLAGAILAGWAASSERDPLRAEGAPLRTLYPVAACEWIEAQDVRGNMFNPYPWGGFLAYALGPARKVYVDSRTRPFVSVFPDEYFAIYNASPGWQRRLSQRGVDWVIVETGARLSAVLRLEPTWRQVYVDARAEVFVRRAGPNQHLVRAGSSFDTAPRFPPRSQ